MKSSVLFVSIATAVFLAACANPGQTYANKHPELTPAQRQILSRGKIPSGDAVAGLTHEQVKLAMGGDPTTFDRINGEEAWVYSHKKMVGNSAFDEGDHPGNSTMENQHSFSPTEDLGPRKDIEVKTTIFFQGDRATHAQSDEDR